MMETRENWREGPVDRGGPHFTLSHRRDDYASPVALVGPAIDGQFPVEWVWKSAGEEEPDQDVLEDVRQELDFYLNKAGGPNPWRYAIYHCGTMANLYSSVRWAGFKGTE